MPTRARSIASASIPQLDVDKITKLATKRAREWNVPWPENVRRPIVSATLTPFIVGSHKRAAAVSASAPRCPGASPTIESFAIAFDDKRTTPITLPETIGWTKVPDVRSFPYRETFSYDGSGYGSPQALVLDADFVFGARPEWYLSHPHIATSTYLYLKSFSRTLPFPKPVDAPLAARGKTLFESRCARCHGFYVDHGDEMRVSYRERVVPKAVFGTDPARVDAVTPSFVEAANDIPLSRGHARVKNTGGYVPPVLLDVWARGLYGHAGQWPSVEVMATPPAERPRGIHRRYRRSLRPRAGGRSLRGRQTRPAPRAQEERVPLRRRQTGIQGRRPHVPLDPSRPGPQGGHRVLEDTLQPLTCCGHQRRLTAGSRPATLRS